MNINLNDFVKALYKEANEKDLLLEIGINHFLNFSKINKRPATVEFYERKFNQLIDYFHQRNIFYISQITNEVLITYITEQQHKGLKATSINKNVGAIKALINYLTENEMINPITIKVKKLKEIIPQIETIDLETIKEIILHLRKHHSIQHQLIFELIVATGIRRTELIFIKRNNINLDDNSIYLERTKNGHPRYIYFSNLIKELIVYEIKNKPTSEYLFVNHYGNQLTTSAIDSFFLRIKKELKIDILSPHKLRHTYATVLLEKEKDMEQIRLLLGHETYEMTKRYLHVNEKKLKETSLNLNPLAYIFHE